MNSKMNAKKLVKPGDFLLESWETHTRNRYRLNFLLEPNVIDISYHFTVGDAQAHVKELRKCLV